MRTYNHAALVSIDEIMVHHKDRISRTLAIFSLILGDQGTLCVQTVQYQVSMPIVLSN